MSQIPLLVTALKRQLKQQGFTYADVSNWLDLSEASVKRLFAQRNFTLERLEIICQKLQLELTDLLQAMDTERPKLDLLSEEQEQQIVDNDKLLLVTICIFNQISFEHIIQNYQISEVEGIRLLAKLDRLKIIDLLPGNRVKLRISRQFKWRSNGPIQRFFFQHVQPEFFRGQFNNPGELLLFSTGMLSRESNHMMQQQMQKLLTDFNQFQQHDHNLPDQQRFGTSLVIAIRPWEFAPFEAMRRQPDNKRF